MNYDPGYNAYNRHDRLVKSLIAYKDTYERRINFRVTACKVAACRQLASFSRYIYIYTQVPSLKLALSYLYTRQLFRNLKLVLTSYLSFNVSQIARFENSRGHVDYTRNYDYSNAKIIISCQGFEGIEHKIPTRCGRGSD